MKTLFLSIVVSVLFFFSTTASATGWDWGNPQAGFVFSGSGWFKAGVDGKSNAYGTGAEKYGETFSVTEQTGEMNVNALRTVFGPGSPCPGTCDQNKTSVGLDLKQKVASGALHNASGVGDVSSFTNSEIGGFFKFGGAFTGFGQ